MTQRHFENWLQAYTGLTTHSESPVQFHFWTAVSVVAAALQRKVWIDEVYFQWTPNFYIILVGPAGIAAKSTSMGIGQGLLRKVDGIHFGPNSTTWQALTDALSEAFQQVPITASPGDMEPLMLPMSCLTCAISELGTFLRPDDQELVDMLTDMWDGQLTVWKRRTRQKGETAIENPWINVIGCTTPAWLRKNVPDTMIGGGLVSRIIFIFGDRKHQLVPYPSDVVDRKAFADVEQKMIDDLTQIYQIVGEYHLTPEAKEFGSSWYRGHWDGKRPEHMASERYAGYYARKQTHIHKLAMVFAAAQRSELIVTLEDVKFAKHMIDSIEEDMGKVFQSIGLSDTAKNVTEFMNYLKNYKELTRADALRELCMIMNANEFKEAVEVCIASGRIETGMKGGEMVYRYKGDG